MFTQTKIKLFFDNARDASGNIIHISFFKEVLFLNLAVLLFTGSWLMPIPTTLFRDPKLRVKNLVIYGQQRGMVGMVKADVPTSRNPIPRHLLRTRIYGKLLQEYSVKGHKSMLRPWNQTILTTSLVFSTFQLRCDDVSRAYLLSLILRTNFSAVYSAPNSNFSWSWERAKLIDIDALLIQTTTVRPVEINPTLTQIACVYGAPY